MMARRSLGNIAFSTGAGVPVSDLFVDSLALLKNQDGLAWIYMHQEKNTRNIPFALLHWPLFVDEQFLVTLLTQRRILPLQLDHGKASLENMFSSLVLFTFQRFAISHTLCQLKRNSEFSLQSCEFLRRCNVGGSCFADSLELTTSETMIVFIDRFCFVGLSTG